MIAAISPLNVTFPERLKQETGIQGFWASLRLIASIGRLLHYHSALLFRTNVQLPSVFGFEIVSMDNSSESYPLSHIQQRILSQFQGDWVQRLDVEQMFTLINSVLPLEACLYYQLLPLFLDGNRLHLGMVSPNDSAALEYVRRIISYLNYSLVPRAITYDALQVVLTGYLNYTGNQPSDHLKRRHGFSYGHYRHSSQVGADRIDQSARPTLIVDSPEDLEEDVPFPSSEATPPPQIPASPTPPPLSGYQPIEADAVTGHAGLSRVEPTKEPPLTDAIPPAISRPPVAAPPPSARSAPSHQPLPPLIDDVPHLELQARYLTSPVEILESLAADEMLQELLARILVGGIGRLYFECHPQYGRVLWSQDGVLQSVMERLPLPTFSQLLDQLKRFAEIPALPITQPRQAEIERLYDRSRVLLRFRFMPGKYGEEATLQVLRGAALRFYQKQQLGKLKRDALGIAKQLQTKLNEIRDRAYAEPGLAAERFETLPALKQLLESLEEQINHIGQESERDE